MTKSVQNLIRSNWSTLIFVLLLITNDGQNTKGHKINKWLFQKFPVPLFWPYLILIVYYENHVAQDASHVTQETRRTYWSRNLLLSCTVSSECYVYVDCRWFRQLNNHFGVRGEAYYLYKPKGKSRTIGLSGEEALHRLKNGLHDPQMAFIYHSYNHYFCPIGYDDSPSKAVDAYRWVLTLALLKTKEWPTSVFS